MDVPFDAYVDYSNVRRDAAVAHRVQFLNVNLKRRPHQTAVQPYAPFGAFFNR
jgi:hypothetical protein